VAFSEPLEMFRHRHRNAIGRHNRERNSGLGETKCKTLGFEDRLGQQRNQPIPAAFRRSFQLDHVPSFARVDEEVNPDVPDGRRAANPPARFAEDLREDAFEFVAGWDAAIRDGHNPILSHGHVISHGHGS
jgi:hypothetical protein